MKLLILALICCPACFAQTISSKQAAKLSKEMVQTIRANSLFKDSLDLDGLDAGFKKNIDTFDTYKKVGNYYVRLLRQAGDNHSFYVHQSDMDKYSKKQKENIGFSYKLDGDIGYLNIPGFLSNDQAVIDNFAEQIRDAIASMDNSIRIRGWIIDLRNNEGGNMWPMLAGLKPLIGNEVPGYFQKTGKEPEPWTPNAQSSGVSIKPYEVKDPTVKIAILYGSKTLSSGEATAICFIGKSNARSFGEKTGGYTTANDIFKLSDGNILVLATSCELDRNRKKYTGPLTPDVLIEKGEDDEVMLQAKAWLKLQ